MANNFTRVPIATLINKGEPLTGGARGVLNRAAEAHNALVRRFPPTQIEQGLLEGEQPADSLSVLSHTTEELTFPIYGLDGNGDPDETNQIGWAVGNQYTTSRVRMVWDGREATFDINWSVT